MVCPRMGPNQNAKTVQSGAISDCRTHRVAEDRVHAHRAQIRAFVFDRLCRIQVHHEAVRVRLGLGAVLRPTDHPCPTCFTGTGSVHDGSHESAFSERLTRPVSPSHADSPHEARSRTGHLHLALSLLAGDQLFGFRSFGPDGQVSGWDYDDQALDNGGGLRPQLVGRRLGRQSISAGLAFGRSRFAPPAFRVTVATFNARVLRTVKALGFDCAGQFNATLDGGSFEVLILPER